MQSRTALEPLRCVEFLREFRAYIAGAQHLACRPEPVQEWLRSSDRQIAVPLVRELRTGFYLREVGRDAALRIGYRLGNIPVQLRRNCSLQRRPYCRVSAASVALGDSWLRSSAGVVSFCRELLRSSSRKRWGCIGSRHWACALNKQGW